MDTVTSKAFDMDCAHCIDTVKCKDFYTDHPHCIEILISALTMWSDWSLSGNSLCENTTCNVIYSRRSGNAFSIGFHAAGITFRLCPYFNKWVEGHGHGNRGKETESWLSLWGEGTHWHHLVWSLCVTWWDYMACVLYQHGQAMQSQSTTRKRK